MLEDGRPQRQEALSTLRPSCIEDDDRHEGDAYKSKDSAALAVLSDLDGGHRGFIHLFLPKSSHALLSCAYFSARGRVAWLTSTTRTFGALRAMAATADLLNSSLPRSAGASRRQ